MTTTTTRKAQHQALARIVDLLADIDDLRDRVAWMDAYGADWATVGNLTCASRNVKAAIRDIEQATS